MTAVTEDVRYEQEILSTEQGRRSSQIREQACRLSERGDLHGAHALFIEAAESFDTDDPGAAAAAAWYDLGESFKKISFVHSIEDLREAERFLRLTIASPARQRAKLRLARSHDALGQTLRRFAQLDRDREERDRLFAEALQNLERACELAEPVGLEDAAGYHHNRGLALEQLERLPEAIDAFRTSLRHLDRADSLGLQAKPSLRPKCRLHLGQALLSRGRRTDLELVLQITKNLIDEGQPSPTAAAHLLAARALLAKGERYHEPAARHLAAVIPHDLPNEHDHELIDLLVEVGDTKTAVVAARQARVRALHERKGAMADHVADRCAEKAQRFAVREARIHVDEGRAIDAFLALENASGLRYYDAVKQYLWRPGSPAFAALTRRKVTNDTLAVQIDDFAARQAFLAAEHQPEALDLAIREHERILQVSSPTEAQALYYERMIAALQRARRHPSPRASLRAQAQELLTQGERLYRAMEAADPSFRRDVRALNEDCSAERLRAMLAEQPGFVLLRLHLSDRLIAASVWLDDDGLQGACASFPLPDRIGELLSLKEIPSREAPEVTTILESLDLSDVLPSRAPRRHVVVLPSSLAARIPWAAAGPRGATLLDRFDAISYLPILTPLQGRQPPRAPRNGTTTLLPGEALRKPTKFHGAAFSTALERETVLWDEQADVDAAWRAAQQSDVVVFYTHGHHGDLDGGIELAGGRLRYWELGSSWAGCERVELWACQTGVNVPTDWLTPPFVDEAFGLDIAFHRIGVRSTIGTLWSVPDAITAYIVRWYRHELHGGCDAPTALARAQRRWRDDLIPKVRRLLEHASGATLVEAMAAELDVNPDDLELDLELSDLATTPLSDQRQRFLDRLAHPKSWAGYRFVGVCERRPTEPWTEEVDRPLTAEEQAQVERFLHEAEQEEVPGGPYDALEAALVEAHQLADDASPTPEQAIRIARLYSDRWTSSHRHNVLRGLAWLHEALAVPDLGAAVRHALELEVAWLWLELARGELPHESLRPLYPASQVALARVEALLASHAEDPQARIMSTWVRVLRTAEEPESDSPYQHQVGLSTWSAALELPADTYGGLRAREAALTLVALDADITVEQASGVLDALQADVARDRIRLEDIFIIERLRLRAMELGDRFELPIEAPHQSVRSHRDLARHLDLMNARKLKGSPDDLALFKAALEDDVGALEGAFWGYPSDRSNCWISSGSPGLAWHRTIGAYSAAKLQQGLHDTAVHFVASIQMGADLRIGVLNARARMGGVAGEHVLGVSRLVRGRELLLQQLDDAAHLGDQTSNGVEPYERDPFLWPAARLHEISEEDFPLALTGWTLADSVRIWSSTPKICRTAAFAVERVVGGLDQAVAEDWSELERRLETELPDGLGPKHQHVLEAFVSCLQPSATLREVEDEIRSLAEHYAILGAFVGGAGELQMAAIWRHAGGLYQRVFGGQAGRALHAARALALIVGPCREDEPDFPTLASRATMFDILRSHLEDGLRAVLPSDATTDAPRQLLVLAPGPLRGAPWSALRGHERPLRETFSSISLLPHVGFERPPRLFPLRPVEPYTVCALGVDDDDPGATVIETLRRLRRVEATAEPTGPISSPTIVEVDVIDAHGPKLRDLRLYGSRCISTVNAATEGIELRGGRVYTVRNMSRTVLPQCACVELWAATGSQGEAGAIQAADRDAMPSLVRAFLQAGAAGVLDLAWPVPKLVKALVCEAFGLRRAFGDTPGVRALNEALLETQRLLHAWRVEQRRGGNLHATLAWLDEARRRRIEGLGADPELVVPLRVPASSRDADPELLVADVTGEIHLAAFRWWGT